MGLALGSYPLLKIARMVLALGSYPLLKIAGMVLALGSYPLLKIARMVLALGSYPLLKPNHMQNQYPNPEGGKIHNHQWHANPLTLCLILKNY